MNEKEQFKDLVLVINEEFSQNLVNKISDAINSQEIDQKILKKIKYFKIEADPEYFIYPSVTMKSGYKKLDLLEEDLENIIDIISGSIHQVKYIYEDQGLMTQYEEFKRKVQVDFLIRCEKMNFNPASDDYFAKVIINQFKSEKQAELDSRQAKKTKPGI